MKAAELIEQIKTLSPEERDSFARLFRELEKPTIQRESSGNGASGPAKWADFGERLKRIYGNKVIADSQPVISYGRGDS